MIPVVRLRRSDPRLVVGRVVARLWISNSAAVKCQPKSGGDGLRPRELGAEVLHLAASIRTGTVSASVTLKKLAGYSRQNSLSRALREIARVERSLFMLDWLDDIDLRRRTHANLNKGEARNALARVVFFNRLGELRDRAFENQRHQASGLNLVSAAIILWNTVYLGRAADYLRQQGRVIRG